MVLGGVKTGTELVFDSFRVFRRYPKLVVPLVFTWVVLAALTIWSRFFLPPKLDLVTWLIVGFGIALVYTFLLSFSCSMLLEMVEHVERGGKPSLFGAFGNTVKENMIRMLPLIIVWSIIWLLLSLIEALFEDDSNSNQDYSAENAARALAGGDGSLLGIGIDALKKGVRMVVFLILPAIAWEDRGFWGATKRGYGVFRDNIAAFATGFSLTYIIAILIFLPVGIVLELSDLGIIELSVQAWYIVIIYTGMGWSFSIYLEQMFTADLFLWHKEWEQAVEAAEVENREAPSMREVPRPTLLDDVASLEERKLPGGGSAPVKGSEE